MSPSVASSMVMVASRPPRLRALRMVRIFQWPPGVASDRKSTRLNSSHLGISYAVFCLKKQNSNPFQTHSLCRFRFPLGGLDRFPVLLPSVPFPRHPHLIQQFFFF